MPKLITSRYVENMQFVVKLPFCYVVNVELCSSYNVVYYSLCSGSHIM